MKKRKKRKAKKEANHKPQRVSRFYCNLAILVLYFVLRRYIRLLRSLPTHRYSTFFFHTKPKELSEYDYLDPVNYTLRIMKIFFLGRLTHNFLPAGCNFI